MTADRKIKLRRTTADGYVEDVRRRIREVNSDQTFCFEVVRAVVFGSYVNEPQKQMLGDLDVAVELRHKYEGDDREFYEGMSRERCPRQDDWMFMLYWPREEVLRHIRNRRAYLSIHSIGGPDDEAIFSKEWMELDIDPVDPDDLV